MGSPSVDSSQSNTASTDGLSAANIRLSRLRGEGREGKGGMEG